MKGNSTGNFQLEIT